MDDYEPSGREDREVMLKTGEWVKVYDIPGILNDADARRAIYFYSRFKRMGMPYGPWGINPYPLVQVVDLLEPLDAFYHPQLKL